MSWFGKTLVVINTVISLVLLGAITWMVLEWRQFRDDAQKIENQLKQQQGRWDSMRNILAGVEATRNNHGKRSAAPCKRVGEWWSG